MIAEIAQTMIDRFSKDTFTVQFPQCFDHLYGSDANFEVSASNTLQPLHLFFSNNVVTASCCIIFLFLYMRKTTLKIDEESVKKARNARKLFKDELKFEEVRTYTNYNK